MSQDDQNKLNNLQGQLTSATNEAKLYRNLFWTLLVLSAGATVLHILQR
jgi:hypothetical protein